MTDADCGCCTTPAAAVPTPIGNRPGLSAIAYRMGTFATFRKAITDDLSRTPELAHLSARVSEDYTITAIELWSAVADVLTFYQERVANEAFLRTATQRDSMLRLVRLIGYELAPGAAATARLAFTLEAGAKALIPPGTRVQSVPGEGEKPQTFETLTALAADARLNKLRVFPHPTAAAPMTRGRSNAIVAPDAEALASAAALSAGDRVMLYAPSALEVLTVRELIARDDFLTVSWNAPIDGVEFAAAFDASDPARGAYKLARPFHLFGFDAAPVVVVPALADASDPTTTYLTQANTDYTLHGDGSGATQLSLDARYAGLKTGATLLVVATTAAGTTAIPFTVRAVAELKVERLATSTATVLNPLVVTVISQSATVTQVTLESLVSGRTLDDLLPTMGNDIRNVVVHELTGSALRFWPYALADLVAAREVCLPGRRTGWSSVELGRTIEKGAYKPGTTVDVKDFGVGRVVLLTDGRGDAPVGARIAEATVAGSGVTFEPTATDVTTIAELGLASDQVTATTVLVSRTLPSPVVFPVGSRFEVSVTLGALPAQTLVLDAATAGSGVIADVAAALEDAVRAALPGSPTFARARVWSIADPASSALAIAPGVPGDRVAFGPSTNDRSTVVALGLDAANARFLDGVVSAGIGSLATAAPELGSLRVTIGGNEPADRLIAFLYTGVASLAAALAADLGLNTLVTEDDRVIVLPPLPVHEAPAYIRLRLDSDSPMALDTASAVLLGNVADASHGETVRNEILGDGDASQAFQRFTLKKKPVTYVPSAAAGGVSSSLTLLVNGVRWREESTLFGANARDQVYVTRIADDGSLSVRFGDGVTGARPNSGRQNIVANYRFGTGLAGRVAATRIATLLDRPTGVKGATNLLPADGGADPEALARAREAAPGTVRTFGRAVSLRDFEDSALMAGEVAKASATWVWTGERRAIHLTVAAQGGARFSADGLGRLAATLASERDPNHKLLIANYASVAVQVSASLIVDPRYVNDEVLAAARATLLGALSFDQRRFAEPVYLSDVFRILQNVAGVVAVDVDSLDLKSTDPGFRAAHGVDDTLPQPQARLLMLPARPGGGAGAVLAAELAWVEVPEQDVTLRAGGGLSL